MKDEAHNDKDHLRLGSASGMAVKGIRWFAICSFTQSDEMQSKHNIQADNSHPIR